MYKDSAMSYEAIRQEKNAEAKLIKYIPGTRVHETIKSALNAGQFHEYRYVV